MTIPVSVSRPLRRRRRAIALLALVWLAQQLGLAAHGEMQRRMVAGGGFGEICTSAGLVRGPADAPAPGQAPSAAGFCDVCAGATLNALTAPAQLAFSARAPVASVGTTAAPALALGHPQRAHRPRAPPARLS